MATTRVAGPATGSITVDPARHQANSRAAAAFAVADHARSRPTDRHRPRAADSRALAITRPTSRRLHRQNHWRSQGGCRVRQAGVELRRSKRSPAESAATIEVRKARYAWLGYLSGPRTSSGASTLEPSSNSIIRSIAAGSTGSCRKPTTEALAPAGARWAHRRSRGPHRPMSALTLWLQLANAGDGAPSA